MDRSDLFAASWVSALVFMSIHITGVFFLGWGGYHPTWLIALALIVAATILAFSPDTE